MGDVLFIKICKKIFILFYKTIYISKGGIIREPGFP